MNYGRFNVADDIVTLNKWKLVRRVLNEKDETQYTDTVLYLDDEGLEEWEVNRIPKHRLWSIADKEQLTGYEWMDGIRLRTNDPERELAEIMACGSLEAYEATLPESRDAFEAETDYRLSLLELGI